MTRVELYSRSSILVVGRCLTRVSTRILMRAILLWCGGMQRHNPRA